MRKTRDMEVAGRQREDTAKAAVSARKEDTRTGAGAGQEEGLEQARRRQRRQIRRQQRARQVRRQRILLAGTAMCVLFVLIGGFLTLRRAWARSKLTDAVLGYSATVEKYARREGIDSYVDTLLAIMMVETEGTGRDVMQSSESKGLERNSLDPEESIEQACIYFAALVEMARASGIEDDMAVIQAYNYGPGYLTFVAENGGSHTQDLAIRYAEENSGGEKIRYLHLYAIKENGGWIYSFGNMFYAALVEQYL
ncbi:MAG: lysozyme family protein [Eubacteriales bacterium]|nr:lysozyme family protein [Eubacteriales bacterium]